MAEIKSLVASTLLALLLVPAAIADSPTLRIDAGDQAWAKQTLLKRGDFGVGWRGGTTRSTKPAGPSCPGFEPKSSDLVVTGHASASFQSAKTGVHVSLETQVLESWDAVRTDFTRTIQPALPGCLAHQLEQGASVTAVTVTPLDFPRLGSVSAAYRATITVRTKGQTAKVLSDFVFFGNGRLEYSLRVDASTRYSPQLVPFEADMARMLLRRGARPE